MKKVTVILSLVFILFSCQKKSVLELNPEHFVTSIEGKETALYTLKNENGLVAQFTNYGARLVALWVPDAKGHFQDVTWGFSTIDDYLNSTDIYCGPVVGRYGNRINRGRFVLNDTLFQLTLNDNGNHLHGGTGGFESKVWDAEMVKVGGKDVLKMSYFSEDGEEGYPGNLTIEVYYSLTADNALRIEYSAATDAPTIINPTSHAYFNLAGTSDVTILEHVLKINASTFTPTDEGLIPTGEIRSVEGTPLDFREATPIGKRINESYQALIFGKGYDHNFILDKKKDELGEAAVISSPQTGIEMTVITDQPALQFYSGNFMDGSVSGKNDDVHNFRTGFALEAQNYPDAPNHSHFPSAVLNPGETYTQTTIYKFSVVQ